MGLTKEYKRYCATNMFGIIGGTRANVKMISYKGVSDGKYLACGACEHVLIWDVRRGQVALKLSSEMASGKTPVEVTAIEHNPRHNTMAVGYLDGSIRLFDLKKRPAMQQQQHDGNQLTQEHQAISEQLTFNGHKTAITALSFDRNGLRLVSGSKDTDLVVWDLVGECGLFRLKGHKAPITQTLFMSKRNILISCGKDMLVKFWDLDTRHCFKTIVSHRSEVNDLCLLNEDTRLITGCHDNELKVFQLTFNQEENNNNEEENEENAAASNLKKLKIVDKNKVEHKEKGDENEDEEEEEEDASSSMLECKLIGCLVRESKDQLSQLCIDETMSVLSAHSAQEKHVELYKINTHEEIKKKLAKKLKKQKRKLASSTNNNEDGDEHMGIEQTCGDEFTRICLVKSKHKIKSVDLRCDLTVRSKRTGHKARGGNNEEGEREEEEEDGEEEKQVRVLECKVACLLQNNQIEVYLVEVLKQMNATEQPTILYTLSTQGHRTDVRTLAFSSDATAFVTGSGDAMKVWNRMSLSCIRSFVCDYALASLFLSDDTHVLLGTKSGKVQLFNINVSGMMENVQAHELDQAVWSLAMQPDKSGFVSGGQDKTVRFWMFELIDDAVDDVKATRKRLTFQHLKTLRMEDDVLAIKISPNGKLLAVATLDSTVKVFFTDSLKMFLNLYGHKQPVLCLDISWDSRLIATGSADRHLKIWGLDFGDCHRSLHAHEDSITGVQFCAKTHYVFSTGKDGQLKEWDCDKFERIQTLHGHKNEIWSLAVSTCGKWALTGSHDKTLRLWNKSNEPLVLSDEREREKEEQAEKETQREEPVIAGEATAETGLAQLRTIETIKSAEKLIESLDICLGEQHAQEQYEIALRVCLNDQERAKIKRENRHPVLEMLGLDGEDYVLEALRKTASSEMETTMLVLEFDYAKVLLKLLLSFVKRNKDVEMCLKCAVFLIKINYGQITTTQTLLPLVEELRSICLERVGAIQTTVGFNLAGLRFLKQQVEENEQVRLFADVTARYREKTKKNKNKNIALMSLRSASSVV